MKSAARQFLISVSDVDGFFTTKSGGETTSEATKEFDGGSVKAEILTGPSMTGDIVIGRAYDPGRDGAFLKRCQERVGRLLKTITIQPTDRDFVRVGPSTSYRGLLVGVSTPDGDANSGDVSRYTLTFAVLTVA